jgi:Zinc knuckle
MASSNETSAVASPSGNAGTEGGAPRSTGGRPRNRGARSAGQGATTSRGPSTTTAPATTPKNSFKGNTKDMNGHVFQVHHEQVDPQQFDKTVQALSEYAMKNLKQAGDLVSFFKDLKVPTIPMVADLITSTLAPDGSIIPVVVSALEQRMWNNAVDSYCAKASRISENLKALYSVAWGQCSEAMQAKLHSHDDFQVNDLDADCSWLLKEIKAITFRFEGQRFIFLSLDDAHTALCTYYQGAEEPTLTYLHNFTNKVEVLEHYGGSFGVDPGLLAASQRLPFCPPPPLPGHAPSAALLKFTRNRSLAIAFVKRADPGRYDTLLIELENHYARGLDQYPVDLSSAYTLVNTYKKPPPPPTAARGGPRPATYAAATSTAANPTARAAIAPVTGSGELGLTFTQNSVVGNNGLIHADIKCYQCNRTGHYATNCPTTTGTSDVQLLQVSPPTACLADSTNDTPLSAALSHFTFA